MREAFKHNLPANTLFKEKHGLTVPVSKWLRYELKEFAFDVFGSQIKHVDGIIDRGFAINLMQRHVCGQEDAGRRLWNLLMFYLWMDKVFSSNN